MERLFFTVLSSPVELEIYRLDVPLKILFENAVGIIRFFAAKKKIRDPVLNCKGKKKGFETCQTLWRIRKTRFLKINKLQLIIPAFLSRVFFFDTFISTWRKSPCHAPFGLWCRNYCNYVSNYKIYFVMSDNGGVAFSRQKVTLMDGRRY